MEYSLLNDTSGSCPSEQTLFKACHALDLPGQRQQLPPALDGIGTNGQSSVGSSLLVGGAGLQGGQVCSLSSRQVFCTPEAVKGCGDASGSSASSAWWEPAGKTERHHLQEPGVTGQGGTTSN